MLEPGETPHENAQFLLFLCAVIRAVDLHQDLLRISACGAGNDHRLGGHEAPPAILSMFLGDELTEILESIANGTAYDSRERVQLKIGVHVLPRFPKDTTDRNRTSPFAFTGNKFEFRMVGSSASIADANTVLNTIVAESLDAFASELETAEDFNTALNALIRRTIQEHGRILFNGNGYDDTWVQEAARRGLLNLPTTPDCVPYFTRPENVRLFTRYGVYSAAEMLSRQRILLETYCNLQHIEALTMLEMVRQEILPAVIAYTDKLCGIIRKMQEIGLTPRVERELAGQLNSLTGRLYDTATQLEEAIAAAERENDSVSRSCLYRDRILPTMDSMRETADRLETLTGKDYWPYPGYMDMLLSV